MKSLFEIKSDIPNEINVKKQFFTFSTVKQFLIFIFVGGLSTIVDISVLWILLTTKAHYLIAVSIGFAAGFIINYWLHARVTFREKPSSRNIIRFVAVTVVNYLLTIAIVYFLNFSLNIAPLYGKIASLPVIAVNGYVLARYWIFRQNGTILK